MSSRPLIALVGAPLLLGVNPTHAEFQGVEWTHRLTEIPGYGPARVVRLYARFDNPDDQLFVVWGNPAFPMSISTGDDAPFYQDAAGSLTAPSQADFGLFCALRDDTYVDIGRATSDSGDDVSLAPFLEIGATAMETDNGSWSRSPKDSLTRAGGDERVFFGQFTVPAEALTLSGRVNLTTREDGVTGTNFGVFFGSLCCAFGGDCCAFGGFATPSTADVDGDLNIDVDDLVHVIMGWGPCDPCPGDCAECFCGPDVTGDGMVDVNDLVEVITQFGSL